MKTHTGVSAKSLARGLKAVAVFEAAKGVLVIAAACGGLTLLHKNVAFEVERLLDRLHFNPGGHLSDLFLQWASNVTDGKLWAAAGAALVYATVRFVEAYGLWHARDWAEWFVLLSGSIYLPWEIYEVALHPSALHSLVFASNLVIVLYMLYVRVRASRTGSR